MGPYRTPAEPTAPHRGARGPDREEGIVHGVMVAGGAIGVAASFVAADFGFGFGIAAVLLALGLYGVLPIGGR
jgi:hypothetical protein